MVLELAIKLIRTDTTLDLSQKAEKGMPLQECPAALATVGLALRGVIYGLHGECRTEPFPLCPRLQLLFASSNPKPVAVEDP